jgi:hypothetical protein
MPVATSDRLLPFCASQVNYLLERLLEADLEELPIIRDALRPHRADVAPRLWGVLESDESAAGARTRAGLALAGLDPPDGPDGMARWQRHAPLLVEQFLGAAWADPRSYAARAEALRPARLALLNALGGVFRDRRRPDHGRLLATTLLADFAADQPEVLVELLKDADAEQYRILLPRLRPFADQTATAQWCQERALASRPWGGAPAPVEDREDTERVAELHGRVLRGGAFYDHPSFLRSAARQSNRPYMIDDCFGFRPERTPCLLTGTWPLIRSTGCESEWAVARAVAAL